MPAGRRLRPAVRAVERAARRRRGHGELDRRRDLRDLPDRPGAGTGRGGDDLALPAGRRPGRLAGTGSLAALVDPLAEARVSVVTFSTFDTDYLLVPAVRLTEAHGRAAARRAPRHRLTFTRPAGSPYDGLGHPGRDDSPMSRGSARAVHPTPHPRPPHRGRRSTAHRRLAGRSTVAPRRGPSPGPAAGARRRGAGRLRRPTRLRQPTGVPTHTAAPTPPGPSTAPATPPTTAPSARHGHAHRRRRPGRDGLPRRAVRAAGARTVARPGRRAAGERPGPGPHRAALRRRLAVHRARR